MQPRAIAVLVVVLSTTLVIAKQRNLRVDVRLINVFATVTDSGGKYIAGLTRDDFVLQEDGIDQEIAHFSHDASVPVSVGLLLDTSGSMQN